MTILTGKRLANSKALVSDQMYNYLLLYSLPGDQSFQTEVNVIGLNQSCFNMTLHSRKTVLTDYFSSEKWIRHLFFEEQKRLHDYRLFIEIMCHE